MPVWLFSVLRQAGLVQLDEKGKVTSWSASVLANAGSLYLGSGSSYAGDYDGPNTVKATHGYDPARAEMRASLLLFGATIEMGTLTDARLVDIAPTVAAWLHLPLAASDGKALHAQAVPALVRKASNASDRLAGSAP